FDQLGNQWLIQAQLLAAVAAGIEAQGTLQLAAGDFLAQPLAQGAFQVAKGFGQAQADFQVTVVYRAQLPHQTALVGAGLAAGKGRHAVHLFLLVISGLLSPGFVPRQSPRGSPPVVPRGGPRIIAAHTRCTRNPTGYAPAAAPPISCARLA